MSVHRSISLWGVWYLQRKSTPKNECLQLKTFDFWRLWKWRNWCDPEDLVFMRGIWSVKTFVFAVSFSISWVIGNTVLLKGVEKKPRKSLHVVLITKSYTYQSFRVKPLEISYSSVNFFSDRDEVLLVSEEFVLTKELGIRQRGLPTSEEHDSPVEFEPQISDHCCATCQLSQNIYPPNGHIIEGNLCLIMSGCSLGYK